MSSVNLHYRKNSAAAMSKRLSSVGIPMGLPPPGDTPVWKDAYNSSSSTKASRHRQRPWFKWLCGAVLLYLALSGFWKELGRWWPSFGDLSDVSSSILDNTIPRATVTVTEYAKQSPAATAGKKRKGGSAPTPAPRTARQSHFDSGSDAKQCPSLLDAPLIDDAALLADPRATCAKLPSSDPDWSFNICQSSTECMAGYIVAKRKDDELCQEGESVVPSLDKATSTFIKNTFGPDSLTITIDGPQRIVLNQPHEYKPGTCRYVYPFQLQSFGVFTIAANLEYENYEGFMEAGDRPAKRSLKELLPRTISSTFWRACHDKCATQHAEPFLTTWSTAREDIPACSREHEINGVYLPAHYSDQKRSLQGYSFTPTPMCRMDSFVEKIHAGSQADMPCRMQKKSILMLGDSHSRFAFQEIGARLEGVSERRSGLKTQDDSRTIGDLHVDFQWDPKLDRLLGRIDQCEDFDKYDVISIGTPSFHLSVGPPASEYHTSAAVAAKLRELAEGISQCQTTKRLSKTRVILLSGPAMAPRDDQGHVQNDRKTNARLSTWTLLAQGVAKSLRLPFVNLFELTLPFIAESSDKLHFHLTDAQDAIVSEILHKMNLCGR